MRRTLGSLLGSLVTLLLVGALAAGCGDDADEPEPRATDPTTASTTTAPTTTDPTTDPDPAPGAPQLLGIVHQTAAGGSVNLTATPIGAPEALADFVSQFRTPGFADLIEAEAAASRSGEIYAAVIAIGCDVPPGAEVSTDEAGNPVVTPFKVKDPLPECLAAVTSVAVLG